MRKKYKPGDCNGPNFTALALKFKTMFLVLIIMQLLVLDVSAQEKLRVTGRITSAVDSDPIIGANVIIKGTTTGVITDVEGKYIIEAYATDVLVFSFIGYASQEVPVGNRSVIDIKLSEDVRTLGEIVVIGYGAEKKKLVTGATVQVKGDAIVRQSTVSPMTALQGQTPGVSIIKSTGEPGAGFKVTVRGMGTIGDPEPLIVIDGVPGGNLDYLNPNDIESIDILKDAASAAIYGSRGANGVILVTTKRGTRSEKNANISYDGYYGVQNLYKKLPLTNAKEYAMLLNESRVNSDQPVLNFPGLVPDWDRIVSGEWQGTDWLDELTVENAPMQSHSISFYGLTDISNYSTGFTYSGQEGIIGNPVASKYERFNFHLNSDYKLIPSANKSFDILKVGESLRYTFTKRNGIGTGNQYWNDVFSASVASPFLPMYAEEETDLGYPYHYAIPWNLQESNPIASMVYNRGLNINKSHNIDGSVYAEIQPIKHLVYRSSFGYRASANSYRDYRPVYQLSSNNFNNTDRVHQNMSVGFNWIFENTVTYNFDLNNDHKFTVLVGTAAEKWGLGESMGATNRNSLLGAYKYGWLDLAPDRNSQTSIEGSPWGEGGMLSYFGRVSYNFREKYMATAIIRSDASSNFPKDLRQGYFPSFSAGWVITEEDFMQGSSIINFFKFRGSWGQNGNQSIPAFQYLATISFENVNYPFGTNKSVVMPGAYPDILPNKDITWETSQQLNIGFDARVLNNRLNVVFDWYNKETLDWLVNADNLSIFGADAPWFNGGDVSNKGIELSLDWSSEWGALNYNIGVNLAHNKNKVTRIANNEGIIYGQPNVLGQGTTELYRAEVGYPIGYFRGYKTLGVFQNQAQVLAHRNNEGKVIQPDAVPGDLIFDDRDGNGQITDNDKMMIGDPNPDYIAGLNIFLGYKGFDFSLNANGMFGHQIARSWRRWADSPQNNFTTDILAGRWHGEGSSNKLPRLTYGAHPNWQNVSDIFIEDGDYFRLSNIQLGYNFAQLMKNSPLSGARVYVSIQNAYTFTKYSGMDPEIGTSTTGDDWAKGVDIGYYPSPRTVMLGVNLKF